jgi:negative regulator of sigma E activity
VSASSNDRSRKDRAGRDYTEFGFRELGADDALDRYFDKEITRESAVFRAAFVKRDFRTQVDETEAMIGELRKPMRTPDLSSAILDAVDARKAFVASRTRRVVTLGRLAVAASVLLAVGGVVLVERLHPGITSFQAEPEPIAGMVSAASMSTQRPIAHEAGPAQGEPKQGDAGSVLMNWTIAKLGAVEAIEVRQCAASTAQNVASSWTNSGVRTMSQQTDPSMEWAVGFATFPTPDQQGRLWTARGW